MQKKLIIVFEKNSEKAANYLRDFVTEKEREKGDDRKYQIETTLWSDKQFEDNQATLSSKSAVVFLGKGKLIRKYTEHIDTCGEYGMTYGYYGKTALLSVAGKISNKDYAKCVEMAEKYELKLKNIRLQSINAIPVGAQIAMGLLIPVAAFSELSANLVGIKSDKDSITQRYKIMINLFYADILEHILED